jgi:hypothetical protein
MDSLIPLCNRIFSAEGEIHTIEALVGEAECRRDAQCCPLETNSVRVFFSFEAFLPFEALAK